MDINTPEGVACVFLISSVFGCVGGIVGAWWRTKKGDDMCIEKRSDVALFAFCGAICAIGVIALGSGVVAFFNHPDFFTRWFTLVFASLIAGFFSKHWLPGIGNKLAEKLEIVSQTAEEAKRQSSTALGYTQALTKACAALKTKTKLELEEAIAAIKPLRDVFPEDRMLAVTYGRLLRWNGQLRDAIVELRTYVSAVLKNRALDDCGPLERSAVGVAYYNIACYHAELIKMVPAEKDRILKEIRSDLKTAIACTPEFEKEGESDEDLEWIFKENPEFLAVAD